MKPLFLALTLAGSTAFAQKPAPSHINPDSFSFSSGGARIAALLYRPVEPSGNTVVVTHGYPGGMGDVLGIAELFARNGWNAIVFNYRGVLNSEGEFSHTNSLDDARAALQYVRSAEFGKRSGVPTNRVATAGYSFGGWVALMTAAADSTVSCVAAVAPFDIAALRRAILADEWVKFRWENLLEASMRKEVRGRGGKAAVAALVELDEKAYDVALKAPLLASRPLLLVSAWNDQQATLEAHVLPLVRALDKAKAKRVTRVVLEDDHAYATRRADLHAILNNWLRTDCR